MEKSSRLNVLILALICSLIASCSGAGGGPTNGGPTNGGVTGGISTGNGSSSSSDDSSNNTGILLTAAMLAGTVLYRSWKDVVARNPPIIQPVLEKQLPIFVVEGGSGRKWEKSDSAYVVFSTKANSLNKKRHVAFCKALRDKFYPKSTKPKSMKSTRTKTFPTIWPSINSFFNNKNSCDDLVSTYDDDFARNVLHQGNYPTDRGPSLVAFSQDFSRKDNRPYWNLSGYEINDFERQISRWFDITSYHPKQMEEMLLKIGSKETTRKIIMGIGINRDSNLGSFASTNK